jgi:hypothetical protein
MSPWPVSNVESLVLTGYGCALVGAAAVCGDGHSACQPARFEPLTVTEPDVAVADAPLIMETSPDATSDRAVPMVVMRPVRDREPPMTCRFWMRLLIPLRTRPQRSARPSLITVLLLCQQADR